MTDIAQLGIAVDATQPAKATKTLEDMATAGGKAEDSTKKLTTATETLAGAAKKVSDSLGTAEKNTTTLEQSTRRANASIDEASNKTVAFISALERQIAVHGKSATEILKYDAALLGVSKAQHEHIQNLIKMADEQNKLIPKQQTAIDQLLQMAKAIGVVALAWKAFDYLKEATLLNARYETLGVSMTVVGKNAGYTAQQMEAAAVAMQKTGISMLESRKGAMQLVQAHIDLADSTKLARIAQDAAVIGGINSSEAFGRMVHGIQSAQVDVLRTIGINVQFEQGYAQMAHTLGKTADQLTENEKSQSRLNQVLEKGKDIAGTYEAAMDTAGKQILSMQRYTEDAKVQIGGLFNEALTVAVMAFTDHLKDTNKELSTMTKNGDIQSWGAGVADVFALVADGALGVVSMLQTIGAATVWLAKTTTDAVKRMKNPFDGEDEQGITNKAFVSMTESIWNNSAKMRNALEARRATLLEQTAKDKRVEESIAQDRLGRFAGDHHQYSDTPAIAKEKKGASPYEQLIGSIKEKIAVQQLDAESQEKLTAGEKLREETLAKMEAGLLKLTAVQKANVTAKLEILIALEKEKAAEDKAMASAVATAKTRSELRKKEEADIKAYFEAQTAAFAAAEKHDRDALKTEEDKLKQYGMTRSQIAELHIAELELKKDRVTAGSEEYASLERQIAMRKRLVGVMKEVENLDASKKVWQDIEQTAHQTFTNIFQGGQDAFTKLRDTLKATLLELLYQMTVKKWIFNIAASVSGNGVANSAFPGMGGSSTGGMFDMVNGASNLNTLYGAGSQFLYGGTAGASNASLLYANGTQAIGGDGLGALIQGNGGWAGVNAGAGASTGVALNGVGATAGGVEIGGAAGIGSGTTLGGGGAVAAGAEGGSIMAAGSAAGPIGLIVAAIITFLAMRDATRVQSTGDSNTQFDANGKIVNRTTNLFGGDKPISIPKIVNGIPVDGAIDYSKYNPSDIPMMDWQTPEQIATANANANAQNNEHMTKISEKADKYVESLNTAYLAAAKNLGVGAVGTSFNFGSNDSNGGKFRLASSTGDASFDSGEVALTQEELKLAASRAIFTALQGSDLPTWMQGVFDGMTAGTMDQEAIDKAISGANELRTAYNTLGLIPGIDLTQISYETLNALKQDAQALATVNIAASRFGYTMLEVSAQGGAAAANLVAAFGDLATFQAESANYFANFFTKDEQTMATYTGVQADLKKVGLDYSIDQIKSATRTDIRAIVDSLHTGIGTATGDAQFAAAIKAANILAPLTPALDAVTSSADKATTSLGGSGGGGGGGGVSGALDSLAQAAKSAMEAIFQEVTRIRGLVVQDNGPAGYAEAQAKLYTANAMANAGDTNAMESLPRLSQAMLALAEKNETSLFDLQFVRAQTAAMLEKTGLKIASDNGFTVPSYDVGTEFVQFDQVAKIHRGEAVITADDNISMKEELFKMRELLEKALDELEAIAIDSKRTADVTEKSDAIGPAPARATL